jgi:hypothetical protein
MRDFEEVIPGEYNFSVDNEELEPRISEEEFVASMGKKQLVALLSKSLNKSEEDITKMFTTAGIDIKDDEEEDDDKGKHPLAVQIEEILKNFTASQDDDDDDDEDEEEDEKEKKDRKTNNSSKKEDKAMSAKMQEDIDKLAKGLGILTASLTEGLTAVEAAKKLAEDNEARDAVRQLSQAGKVLPAEVDDYVKLYSTNKELFDKLTKDMAPRINFDDPGDYGNLDNAYNKTLSAKEREEEIERYSKMPELVAAGGGKHDTISRGDS